ncbi:MAG TPA: hypothetical protein VER17_07850 [Tepidisphaeraceae bacterium]|nr:hypothetical protein [Tepidisphaeraceae bacterium]
MKTSAITLALAATLVAAGVARAADSSFSPGQAHRVEDRYRAQRQDQPYRLTGEQRQVTRKVIHRDVPSGRGQMHSLPFVVWVQQ